MLLLLLLLLMLFVVGVTADVHEAGDTDSDAAVDVIGVVAADGVAVVVLAPASAGLVFAVVVVLR